MWHKFSGIKKWQKKKDKKLSKENPAMAKWFKSFLKFNFCLNEDGPD